MLKLQDDVISLVNFKVEVIDVETGNVIDKQETHNKVVASGRNLLRDLLTGAVSGGITHFALGTDDTSVADADTALGAEVHRDSITQVVDNGTGSFQVKHFLSSLQANGNTLTEAGLFTAASGGTMYARVTFTGIPKTTSIAVNFFWTVTIEEVSS